MDYWWQNSGGVFFALPFMLAAGLVGYGLRRVFGVKATGSTREDDAWEGLYVIFGFVVVGGLLVAGSIWWAYR